MRSKNIELIFHLPWQKHFERRFYRHLETASQQNSKDCISSLPKRRIKWNQLNNYLNGEEIWENGGQKSFLVLLMEFMSSCKFSKWDFKDFGAKLLSKLRIRSFQMTFLNIRDVMRTESSFQYIEIAESWPIGSDSMLYEEGWMKGSWIREDQNFNMKQ